MMPEWHHSNFSRTTYALPESIKKKKFKIKFEVLLKFAQILPDYLNDEQFDIGMESQDCAKCSTTLYTTVFRLFVDEDHSKLPTLYWLPKLHKRPYKSRFIANSSACTTTELSSLLTSCLTAIKNHVIKYCTTVYERNGKNLFWSIKNSGEILNKLKSRGFLASGLSTYDFSTLYTTLPHDLIKDKLTELIEQTFNREG